MNRMMRLLVVVCAMFFVFFCVQDLAAQQQCDGPPELCQQLAQLKQSLAQARGQEEVMTSERAMKLMGLAAALATGLKMLLSMSRNWTGYFSTDRAKAAFRAICLVVGVLASVATNVGFGIPLWQAVIVGGGGPGAIALHELLKLVPVMRGVGKLPADTENTSTGPVA